MTTKPPSGEDFEGVIGRTVPESTPWWPPSKTKSGAPNVVLIVLDDTGFSHFGCYGSTMATPNIDALAAGGLQYTGFHTTAVCSASRACLLTGRNHHSVGMRLLSNFDTGFPNMRGAIPKSAATVAEVLRENGFATFATGKWHLAPMSECSAAGPYSSWPLQRGFDRYYGFLQAETDQYFPELTHDNHFVDPPALPEDGYHLSEDIVDRSATMIRDLTSSSPERPFFLYLAFGAMHTPHQAPKAYLDKYRGRFDAGWDVAREEWFARQKAMGVIPQETKLAPHNPGVKPWAELSTNEQRLAARLQEAFAAMLEHTDDQIGRLIEFLKSVDKWDNTLFIVTSDNGASQEGGATGVIDKKFTNGFPESVDEQVLRLDDIGGRHSYCNIPWGWAQAGNTPLKWYKQNTHGGGVRDPLIMHWPAGFSTTGATRDQFCHAIDIAPTILDVVGIPQPDTVAGVPQMPVHGVSLAPSFADPKADLDRGAQYFEMLGHRGIYRDGWKAVTWHRPGKSFEEDRWELYHLAEDFSEHDDLAAAEPEQLKTMIDLWWAEAERNGVLPLDDRGTVDLYRASVNSSPLYRRSQFVYYPPLSHLVGEACPAVGRGWTTAISLVHPSQGGDGALISRGNLNIGFVLLIRDGRLVFDYNAFHTHTRLEADEVLAPGPHEIGLTVDRTASGGADMSLIVDGRVVATGQAPRLIFMIVPNGMDIGRSPSPVTDEYVAPFEYAGVISKVVFETPQDMVRGELKAQLREVMTTQ